jgi:hypothetical protein
MVFLISWHDMHWLLIMKWHGIEMNDGLDGMMVIAVTASKALHIGQVSPGALIAPLTE